MSSHRKEEKHRLRRIALSYGRPDRYHADEIAEMTEPPLEDRTNKSIKALARETVYLYVDGSFSESREGAKGSWAWIAVSWNRKKADWSTVAEGSAGKIRDVGKSAQMELRAANQALKVGLGNYSDRALCLRTDLESLAEIGQRYLATYKSADPENGRAERVAMRSHHVHGRNKINHGLEDEYHELFSLLDDAGQRKLNLSMEHTGRCSDKWSNMVHNSAIYANLGIPPNGSQTLRRAR